MVFGPWTIGWLAVSFIAEVALLCVHAFTRS